MPAIETVAESVEQERLISWRQEELERAGYDKRAALALALETTVDLHLAVNIIRRGCPQRTALRILL